MKVITDAGTIDLGTTEAAPTIGIVDFSRRVTDDFGVTTVVERGFARRMSVRLVLPSDQVDSVQQQLAEIRATPALWVADERFEWLSFEGFYREFELDLALPPVSYCTLTVEGLTVSEPVADPGGDPAPDGRPSTLQLLRPVALTSAMLLSSNVPENDHPEWSAAVTYGLGAKVIKAAAHRVYESVAGGNVGNDPEGGSGLWVDIGPTNRWAMFDEALGTATSRSGSVAVTLDAGAVGAVALLDVVGATVRVQAPGYDETVPVGPGAITFLDLPGVDDAVTITVAGSNVEIGTLLVGDVVPLGTTEANPSAGINDFSVKETDEFGDVTIVERAWSKRMRARAKIRTEAVDLVANRIAGVRAKPSLWIGNEGTDSLTIYGFFRDFSIEVGQTLSTLELSIEGLSKAPPPKPLAPINWTDIVDNDPVNRPRPDDGADVTGENTSRDTENVNGKPADQVISELDQLELDSAAHTSGIAAAEAQIADLFGIYGDTASAAASAAAALAHKNNAEVAANNAEQAEADAVAARNLAQAAVTAAEQAKADAESAEADALAAAGAAAGSASTAAGHASTATTKANEAAGSASAAAGSATTATTKAGEASVSAGQAASSATTAEGHKNAAASSATVAANARDAAQGHASAASSSAATAGTHASDAATSASAAQTAETNAATKAGEAAASAGSAATSATNAEGSASAAASSATVAASARDAVIRVERNGDFINQLDGWEGTSGFTWEAAQSGRANVISSPIGESSTIYSSPIPITSVNQRFRLEVGFIGLANGVDSVWYLGYICRDASGAILSHSDGTGNYPLAAGLTVPGSGGWIDRTVVVGPGYDVASPYGGTTAFPAGAVDFVLVAYINYFGANSRGFIDYFKASDVTSELAAAAAASAAASSASSAAASQSGAASAASAAQADRVLAETARSQAQAAQGQSATSETNAAASAASAATSANVAASSQSAAIDAAAQAMPLGFGEEGRYYFYPGNLLGAKAPVVPGYYAPGDISFVTEPGEGQVLQVNAPGHYLVNIHHRGYLRLEAGRRYVFSGRFRAVSGTTTTYLGVGAFGADGYYLWQAVYAPMPDLSDGNWHTVEAEVTAEYIWAQQPSAVYITAMSLPVWEEGVVGVRQVSFLGLRDVTAERAAAASAAASVSSASTASTKAAEAEASALAAQSSATAAQIAAGDSTTAASSASGSASTATASAAAALNYMNVMASIATGGLNRSSTFADNENAGGAPTNWTYDPVIGPNSAIVRMPGENGIGWSLEMYGAPGESCYFAQPMPGTTFSPLNWYVVELDFFWHGGSLQGSGFYFANAGAEFTLSTLVDFVDASGAAPVPQAGRAYRLTALKQMPAGYNPSLPSYFYLMAHWPFLGDISTVNHWRVFKAAIRAATKAEIDAGVALPALQATVSTQASALATLNSQYASLNDTVGVQGVTITNHTSALATHAGNISTLFGRAGVRVDVNGRVIGWETNNNGQTGDFKVLADRFSIEKPGGGDGMTWTTDSNGRGTQRVTSGGVHVVEVGYLG